MWHSIMYICGFHLVEITQLFVLLTYKILMFISVSSGLCSSMVGVLCTVHSSLLKHVGGKIVCIFLMCFMCTSSCFLIKRSIICCMV